MQGCAGGRKQKKEQEGRAEGERLLLARREREKGRGRRWSAPRTCESRLRQRPAERAAPRAWKLDEKKEECETHHGGSECERENASRSVEMRVEKRITLGRNVSATMNYVASECECKNASRWFGM